MGRSLWTIGTDLEGRAAQGSKAATAARLEGELLLEIGDLQLSSRFLWLGSLLPLGGQAGPNRANAFFQLKRIARFTAATVERDPLATGKPLTGQVVAGRSE